jgi:hypothetical protein
MFRVAEGSIAEFGHCGIVSDGCEQILKWLAFPSVRVCVAAGNNGQTQAH